MLDESSWTEWKGLAKALLADPPALLGAAKNQRDRSVLLKAGAPRLQIPFGCADLRLEWLSLAAGGELDS